MSFLDIFADVSLTSGSGTFGLPLVDFRQDTGVIAKTPEPGTVSILTVVAVVGLLRRQKRAA